MLSEVAHLMPAVARPSFLATLQLANSGNAGAMMQWIDGAAVLASVWLFTMRHADDVPGLSVAVWASASTQDENEYEMVPSNLGTGQPGVAQSSGQPVAFVHDEAE